MRIFVVVTKNHTWTSYFEDVGSKFRTQAVRIAWIMQCNEFLSRVLLLNIDMAAPLYSLLTSIKLPLLSFFYLIFILLTNLQQPQKL
jgi:hypothetical protein